MIVSSRKLYGREEEDLCGSVGNGSADCVCDRPLPDDGHGDSEVYNKEHEQLDNPKWFGVPWLFSECYLYR